jgi:hypothetical protein
MILIEKLRSRTWCERGLLLEALVLLGLLRAAILIFPFQRVARLLRLMQDETPQIFRVPETRLALAERIGWAVRAAAARTPWQSACLVQALAGMLMLQRRKLPGVLTLAVAKNGIIAEGFSAHAWLRCGEVVLTGEGGHKNYKAIATFATSLTKNL